MTYARRQTERTVAPHIAAALGFAALAVAFTWPLAAHASDHIAGAGAGDNMQFLWNFWWMRQALAGPESFFYSTFLFYPAGFNLALHTHAALNALAGATLLAPLPLVTAVNVTVIGSVALNGFCAYLLAWHVTRSCVPSLAAGAFFSTSPYFAAHLNGHFNLMSAWTLPLFALLLITALDRRSALAAVSAGLSLAATMYLDAYYVVYAVGLAAIVLAYRAVAVRVVRRQDAGSSGTTLNRVILSLIAVIVVIQAVIWWTGGGVFTLGGVRVSMRSGSNLRTLAWILLFVWLWRRWRPAVTTSWRRGGSMRGETALLTLAGAAFVVASAPVLRAAFSLWRQGDYVAPEYQWRSGSEGIDVASLLIGSPFHPLWGDAVMALYRRWSIDPIESVAWLGAVPLLMLFVSQARSRVLAQSDARLWTIVAGGFLLAALGPRLLLLGVDTGLLLPQMLARFIPVVSNARIPGRAMVMVYLSVSVLLAIAFASMGSERRRWLSLFGVALAIDFCASPFPLVAVDRPAIYQRLAALPPGAVVELPFGVRDGFGETGLLDQRTLYYQSIHEKPVIGGFAARLPDRVRRQYDDMPILGSLLRLSSGERVSPEVMARDVAAAPHALRELNVRYFVLDTAAAPEALRTYVATVLPVQLVIRDGERELYVALD